jgi:hypothetical protein
MVRSGPAPTSWSFSNSWTISWARVTHGRTWSNVRVSIGTSRLASSTPK